MHPSKHNSIFYSGVTPMSTIPCILRLPSCPSIKEIPHASVRYLQSDLTSLNVALSEFYPILQPGTGHGLILIARKKISCFVFEAANQLILIKPSLNRFRPNLSAPITKHLPALPRLQAGRDIQYHMGGMGCGSR